MLPSTLQKDGKLCIRCASESVNVPAGTACAKSIVVFGSLSEPKFSQGVAGLAVNPEIQPLGFGGSGPFEDWIWVLAAFFGMRSRRSSTLKPSNAAAASPSKTIAAALTSILCL